MPPGLYRIQYSFIGCQTVEALINLPNDTTYKYNVQLNCEALAANVPVVTFKTIKNKLASVQEPAMSAPIQMDGTPVVVYYPGSDAFVKSKVLQ
jgi:hypothetical protein